MNHVADKLQNPVTVRVERRRARRYPCVVSVELTDLQSDLHLQERVTVQLGKQRDVHRRPQTYRLYGEYCIVSYQLCSSIAVPGETDPWQTQTFALIGLNKVYYSTVNANFLKHVCPAENLIILYLSLIVKFFLRFPVWGVAVKAVSRIRWAWLRYRNTAKVGKLLY
jgi:hypothetical protein